MKVETLAHICQCARFEHRTIGQQASARPRWIHRKEFLARISSCINSFDAFCVRKREDWSEAQWHLWCVCCSCNEAKMNAIHDLRAQHSCICEIIGLKLNKKKSAVISVLSFGFRSVYSIAERKFVFGTNVHGSLEISELFNKHSRHSMLPSIYLLHVRIHDIRYDVEFNRRTIPSSQHRNIFLT